MTVKSIGISQILLTNKTQFFLFDSNAINKRILDSFSKRYLHENETITLYQRKKHQAKQEFIISRLLIKLLFIKSNSRALHQIEIRFNEINLLLEVFYLDKLQPISVSLSHSKGVIFLALSRSNVSLGVDIEHINYQRDVSLLAKHFYHFTEAEQIEQRGTDAFYRIWTLKEAISKYLKQPIVTTLKQNIFDKLALLSYQSAVYKDFDLSFVGDKTENSTVSNSINLFKTQDFLNEFNNANYTDLKPTNEKA